jgi:hypothetical protein
MTAAECLRLARAKIEQPEAWAQGFFAYKPAGSETWRKSIVHHGRALHQANLSDDGAICWCATGAVFAVTGNEPMVSERPLAYLTAALREITQAGPTQNLQMKDVVAFNDAPHRRHEEVLNLFDVAIRLAEQDEQADDHPEAHL